jgi:drug/metabolite transporter (DMT)-like permease
MLSLPIIATFVSVFCWTITNLASRSVSRGLGNVLGSAVAIGLGVLPMALGVVLVGVYSIPATDIILAALAGIFASAGAAFGYKAVATEQLSNAVALQEVYPPILVIFGVLVLGERLTGLEAAGTLVIFLGAFFVITNEELKINRRLIPALAATICWAFYWIVLTYSINGSGTFALPVMISRVAATAFLVIIVLRDRKNSLKKIGDLLGRVSKRHLLYLFLGIGVLAGLSDGVGDTLFAYTFGSGAVAIGSALSALTPIVITVASYFIYREKLTRLQLVGVAVMVIGALALSIA